jgi:hypothetical protein
MDRSDERLKYGSITLDCIELLLLKISLWEQNLIDDDGPYWRCTVSIATEGKRVVTTIKQRIALKQNYKNFEDMDGLRGFCDELARALRRVDLILNSELFNSVNSVGDMIRWKLVRRFDAPGSAELPEGKKALAELDGIHRELFLLLRKIEACVPNILAPGARLSLNPV